ncbi:MAG: hypothetical protein ACXWCW_27980, partial [Burkholderiales bacterium]
LSYGPVSVSALEALTPEILADAVRGSDMFGKDLVLERIDQLYSRYVANVDTPSEGDPSTA